MRANLGQLLVLESSSEFVHFILRKPKRNVTCAATARRIRHQALSLSITSETRGTTLIVFPYIE